MKKKSPPEPRALVQALQRKVVALEARDEALARGIEDCNKTCLAAVRRLEAELTER